MIATAGITLLEYVTGRSFGIDQLLVTDPSPVPVTAPPGRMGINTAMCFGLGGIALAFTKGPRTLQLVSQALALSSAAIAAVAIVAYAYSVQSVSGFVSYTQMAVHTAVGLLVLGVGITAVHPDAGIAGIINSSGPGGMLVRKVLPAILTGPFLLGWIRLQGQRAGLYETEFGLAMFVVASSLVLAGILVAYGGRVDRIDARRRAAEEEVRQHDERMRFALAAAKTGVWELDIATHRLRWSDTMASIFGVSINEAPHEPRTNSIGLSIQTTVMR